MQLLINGKPYAVTAPFHSIDTVHSVPHQGVDLAIPTGTPIPSITNGVVTRVTDEGTQSFGRAITVHTSDGRDVIYGHLSQQSVHVGQTVQTGDVVGLSGSTGHSTGPHLHVQVMQDGHAIDPTPLLQNPTVESIPWWDIEGHADRALHNIEQDVIHQLVTALHGLVGFIGIALPTLALVGVIWWMVPFFPKSDNAPKLVGSSLIVYLFYALLRGAA